MVYIRSEFTYSFFSPANDAQNIVLVIGFLPFSFPFFPAVSTSVGVRPAFLAFAPVRLFDDLATGVTYRLHADM